MQWSVVFLITWVPPSLTHVTLLVCAHVHRYKSWSSQIQFHSPPNLALLKERIWVDVCKVIENKLLLYVCQVQTINKTLTSIIFLVDHYALIMFGRSHGVICNWDLGWNKSLEMITFMCWGAHNSQTLPLIIRLAQHYLGPRFITLLC